MSASQWWTREGRKFMLETTFSEKQSTPANFYLGLATSTGLAEDATMASTALVEVTGAGYARKAIPSSTVGFPTPSTAGTKDYSLGTKGSTFRPTSSTAAWNNIKSMFLTNTTSSTGAGVLIGWARTSATRTLSSTSDSLQATMTLQQNAT